MNNYVDELIDEEINDVAVSNLNKNKKQINNQLEEQTYDNTDSQNELNELEEVDCLICLEPIENYTPGN